jgi:hypothetical protein
MTFTYLNIILIRFIDWLIQAGIFSRYPSNINLSRKGRGDEIVINLFITPLPVRGIAITFRERRVDSFDRATENI